MKFKIQINDMLFKLRINLSLILLKFISKLKKNSTVIKNLKFIFLSLKEKGFCKVENFYSENEMKYINNLLTKNNFINDANKNKNQVRRVCGSQYCSAGGTLKHVLPESSLHCSTPDALAPSKQVWAGPCARAYTSSS